jgi:hypothetical protein
MNTNRFMFSATLLADGRVLMAGGWISSASAELYDPTSGTFTSTGKLRVPRFGHRALLLPSGKALIVGGSDNNGNKLASVELYDPATGTFELGGNMTSVRHGPSVTLLPSGLVLIAGGWGSLGPTASTELYDPETGTSTAIGNMTRIRNGPSATLLPNGLVLIAGGMDTNDQGIIHAELYDPTSGMFSAAADMTAARDSISATLLSDGKVLIAGGSTDSNRTYDARVELYEYSPSGGTFTAAGNMTTIRNAFASSLLPSGMVLFIGGQNGNGELATTEVYDPSDGSFTLTGTMSQDRVAPTATLLATGKVLIAGGGSNHTQDMELASAELYEEF